MSPKIFLNVTKPVTNGNVTKSVIQHSQQLSMKKKEEQKEEKK